MGIYLILSHLLPNERILLKGVRPFKRTTQTLRTAKFHASGPRSPAREERNSNFVNRAKFAAIDEKNLEMDIDDNSDRWIWNSLNGTPSSSGLITVVTKNGDKLKALTTNFTVVNDGNDCIMILAYDNPLVYKRASVTTAFAGTDIPGLPMKRDGDIDVRHLVVSRHTLGFYYIRLGNRRKFIHDIHFDLSPSYKDPYVMVSKAPANYNAADPDTSKGDILGGLILSLGKRIVPVLKDASSEYSLTFKIPADMRINLFKHYANSAKGMCGSILYGPHGAIGIHVGGAANRECNYFVAFARPDLSNNSNVSTTINSNTMNESRNVKYSRYDVVAEGHVDTIAIEEALLSKTKQPKQKVKSKTKKSSNVQESIVSMSPAPSDYIGPLPKGGTTDIVQEYIDILLNPWSTGSIRLPDHVITPTSVAKFFANRTYTISRTGTAGPNLLFGLNTRLSLANTTASAQAEVSPFQSTTPSGVGYQTKYPAVPGNILEPIQWGLGPWTDPTRNYVSAITGVNHTSTAWSDDYGTTLASTLPYVSAYRTLAAAIRVRIVGLPTSQFMTPGKIYFAQVRYDLEDLPVTEQDFVTLEQLGRASHVSADAVREAGSKTVFMTPDGAEKFGMVSNFLMAPGLIWDVAGNVEPYATYTQFPTVPKAIAVANSSGNAPFSALSAVVPYTTTGDSDSNITLPFGPMSNAKVDNADMANADSTSLLIVGYFGAADGVVLEVDYANVIEYIPNKKSPAGVEARVQLPSASAMDAIFSASAVCSQYRPLLIQADGDKTITSSVRSMAPVKSENLKVRAELARVSQRRVGSSMREGMFDFLKQGNIGWSFHGDKDDDYVPVSSNYSRPTKARK